MVDQGTSGSIHTVGYIGLGIMGEPMARNIMNAGFDVWVYNRTASKADALVEQGAKRFDSPAVLAEAGPDVILLNVTDTPDVEAVLFGGQGVASTAKAGLIVADHSTISPVATQDFAARLTEQDVTLLDAPVSGGDVGAQKGTLSIMVGGDEAAFQRVLPVLQAEGKNIVRLGNSGMGQLCKACNQICVSCNLLGVVEALALAKKGGLDLDKLIEAIKGGAAGSWQLENLGPKLATGDHAPGFMIDLVLKDLNIVNDTAGKLKLPLSGTSLAESYFRAVAASEGGGRLGTQAMAEALERLGGFKFDA